MSRLRLLLVATTLALAGVIVGPASAQALPDTSDNTINVIQHNTDQQGPGPAMQAASAVGADAITYQELCKSQIGDLEAAGYRVAWSRQIKPRPDGKCAHGPAVASVHRFGSVLRKFLIARGSGSERRTFKLVCADLLGTGVAKTTVCTTHLPLDYNGAAAPTGEQNRIAAATLIRRAVNAKIGAGRRVVLTGDMNDGPKSAPLDRFYRTAGNGRFYEGAQTCANRRACRAVVGTTDDGRMLDYFFASTGGVRLQGLGKRTLPEYDAEGHFVVHGSVTFRPRG